ncbi:hypothetical protein GMOD_00000044 [Pyrenophora seminiperda CCB06]|uniref:Secreted protein n=1 Tax=Pyrenophora seminiperda CCB06 TaxID=1302712 RepID=A0A3M7M6A1_9PLEO|nr:hypothetical protein GMOD_00000044 [Pyrenophora seminiperda CCB06]
MPPLSSKLPALLVLFPFIPAMAAIALSVGIIMPEDMVFSPFIDMVIFPDSFIIPDCFIPPDSIIIPDAMDIPDFIGFPPDFIDMDDSVGAGASFHAMVTGGAEGVIIGIIIDVMEAEDAASAAGAKTTMALMMVEERMLSFVWLVSLKIIGGCLSFVC